MNSRDLTSYISFPGLGIGEFKIDSVAFSVFGYEIVWYGVIITLGIIAAFSYVMYRAKQERVKTDDILDLAIYTVLAGLIGARLYYVAMRFDTYIGDSILDTLYNIIAVWNGGLAIYGGIIGGALAAVIVLRVKKIKVSRVFDMLGPAVMLGQLIGRWGNFFNAEAYGAETDLPWRMGIRNIYHAGTIYVHPTFLYESLWNLLGFAIINLCYKKKKFDGQIFLMYVAWYGLGRMFIEGLRSDSLYVGEIRISQLVAFVTCVAAVLIMIALFVRAGKGKTEPTVFMAFMAGGTAEVEAPAAAEVTGEGAVADNKIDTDKADEPEKPENNAGTDGKPDDTGK